MTNTFHQYIIKGALHELNQMVILLVNHLVKLALQETLTLS